MLLSVSVNFRKTYYILPNLFTLSSVFCGFISISLSTSGEGNADLYQAALAICFGFFFDTADGRVARLTKTQTDLGRDLDSLADLVTFGVAPAILVYRWGLTSFGRLGHLHRRAVRLRRRAAAGAVQRTVATRGSRGREEAGKVHARADDTRRGQRAGVDGRGRPQRRPYRLASEGVVAAVVLVLSYLMVSRVKFRSFKDLRLTRKTVELMLLIAGCWVVVAMNGVDKALIFLVLIVAYIVLGVAETVLLMKRKFVEQRQEKRAQSEAAAAVEARGDEEVLRELGAFDDATTDES